MTVTKSGLSCSLLEAIGNHGTNVGIYCLDCCDDGSDSGG
jgi:hypothetical protein